MPTTLRAAAIAAILVLGACSSDSSGDSNPVDPGDGVSFSADVRPLLSASCSGSGCHIGQTTNGVNLSGYAQIIASSGVQYGQAIVIAGDADASPIIDKVSSANPQFGERMPLGRSPLSSSQIATLRTWIEDGALDN